MPSSLHVVAIDDDAADLAMVRRAVHRITDIDIDIETFSDPYRGLEYIATHDVHAIFLDFDLGPCDALEILNEIQARHIHTPVIILTGHESTDLAVETVHHGAADFLPKGRLSQQSLQRSLKNALEKSELQQQIESHRQELEMRNIELERRNDEISRFYHHVSHELKTPLTSAREFVSIVLDEIAGEITAQQREYLSISLDSCNEMVRHLNDLLDVTRIETGKLSLEKEDVDLTDLVARSAEAMRPTVDKAQLSLVVEAPPETCRASVDPGRVRQIVSNLIGNAAKFTDPGGTITVRLERRDEEFWALSVRDTGRGIPAEHLEKIFDRLYQVADADGYVGGLGIGLNLCREIARLHDGEIEVESELDRGTVFTVSLPAVSPHALSSSV